MQDPEQVPLSAEDDWSPEAYGVAVGQKGSRAECGGCGGGDKRQARGHSYSHLT